MNKSMQFTVTAQQALHNAKREAHDRNNAGIAPEHLLIGSIIGQEGVGNTCLLKLGVPEEALLLEIEAIIGKPVHRHSPETLLEAPENDSDTEKVLRIAAEEAKEENKTYVGTEHILLGILKDPKRPISRRFKDRWNVYYELAKFAIHHPSVHRPRQQFQAQVSA